MSPHGTLSRYTNGKCRCDECRVANKVYRNKCRLGQSTRILVHASVARKHVRFLLTHGWSGRQLAKHLGLDRCTIQAIASGEQKLIDVRTEKKILAANLSNAPYLEINIGGARNKWVQ